MNSIKLIVRMDHKIFQELERRKHKIANPLIQSFMDRVLIHIAKFSPIAMLTLIFLIGIYEWWSDKVSLFFVVPICIIAGFLSRFISGYMSRLIPRKRPFQLFSIQPLLEHEPEHSFPSNHAAGGFALALSLFSSHHIAGFIYLIWAVVLAFSRLYVRLHFFSDVLAGAVIGIASGIICSVIGQSLFIHF